MGIYRRNRPLGRKKGTIPHKNYALLNLTTYGRGNSLLDIFPSKEVKKTGEELSEPKKRAKKLEFNIPETEDFCAPKLEPIRPRLSFGNNKIYFRKAYGYSHKGNRNRNQNIAGRTKIVQTLSEITP